MRLGGRPRNYRLDGHEPVVCDDLIEWAIAAEEAARTGTRVVMQNDIEGGAVLSTVFLGIDHAWRGPPQLFETMYFPKGFGDVSDAICLGRCATWGEAQEMHLHELERLAPLDVTPHRPPVES